MKPIKSRPDFFAIILIFVLLSNVLLASGDDQVEVCHIVHGNLENTRTITVSSAQVDYYLSLGDTLGACTAEQLALPGQDVASAFRPR